jgi:hypothetical protein
MALKAVPLERVESYRLDDPRRPAPAPPKPAAAPQAPAPQAPTVKRPQRREAAAAAPAETAASSNRDATSTEGVEQSSSAAMPAQADVVNPYGHAGRPHQVALSLYVPQWERIEEQCGELRARAVRDATVTRWLFAVLHLRAPHDPADAAALLRRWARMEADEDSFFGLRKQARGIRLFDDLWERQRALVVGVAQGSGVGRPTLAMWTCAVVELCGPQSADEARVLLRELRQLLAGDPA